VVTVGDKVDALTLISALIGMVSGMYGGMGVVLRVWQKGQQLPCVPARCQRKGPLSAVATAAELQKGVYPPTRAMVGRRNTMSGVLDTVGPAPSSRVPRLQPVSGGSGDVDDGGCSVVNPMTTSRRTVLAPDTAAADAGVAQHKAMAPARRAHAPVAVRGDSSCDEPRQAAVA